MVVEKEKEDKKREEKRCAQERVEVFKCSRSPESASFAPLNELASPTEGKDKGGV